jgi:hypothetical protein
MSDLLDSGGDGGAPAGDAHGKKPKKPLSKGQKIGVVIGVVTILLVVVQIERSKASTAAAASPASSTPIDPQTGFPEGSAQDQAALSQIGSSAGAGGLGSGGGGYYSVPTSSATQTDPFQGTDPSTGLSYASEISSNTTGISTLQQEWSSEFSTLSTEIAGISTTQTQPGTSPAGPRPTGPTAVAATAAQVSTLAKLNQELGKDQAAKNPNKTAIATLKKQITAVTKRS